MVRIVFEGLYFGGLVEDVVFEVDDVVELFVIIVVMVGGDVIVDVMFVGFVFGFGEGVFGVFVVDVIGCV